MFTEGTPFAVAASQEVLHVHTKYKEILKTYLKSLFDKYEIKRKAKNTPKRQGKYIKYMIKKING